MKKETIIIEVTKTLEREVSEMCNLSKGVEEKGIKKGRAEDIRILMKNLNRTAEQAVGVLGVLEFEQPEYREALAKHHC